MANSIALITKYLADVANLNGVFKDSSLTADLEAANSAVKPTGANTIKLKKIAFGAAGVGTYSRSAGFTALDSNLTWETITLTQDIGNKLMIDTMDQEEGGTDAIAYVNEYVRTLIVPKVDKYRLETIAGFTGVTSVNEAAATTAENIEAHIDAGITSLKNNEVPTEGAILYITVANSALLQSSSKTSHQLIVTNNGGAINKEVKFYNGLKVVEVPTARMPSSVDFIIVQPKSVWAVVKHNPCEFYEKVPGYDGSEVDYRMYHDAGVLDQRKVGVYVSVPHA